MCKLCWVLDDFATTSRESVNAWILDTLSCGTRACECLDSWYFSSTFFFLHPEPFKFFTCTPNKGLFLALQTAWRLHLGPHVNPLHTGSFCSVPVCLSHPAEAQCINRLFDFFLESCIYHWTVQQWQSCSKISKLHSYS